MIPNEPDFLNYKKLDGMTLLGEYGFPKIKGIKLKHPEDMKLLGFNYCTAKRITNRDSQWVHFFIPDYRFQQVWNNPQKYIDLFKQYKGICSPDFSVYYGMPKAMQIFNIYRSAFLTAYYQQYGIKVLPSVTWGEPDTYKWVWSYIPKGSAIIVSTVGCMQNKQSTIEFLKGYEKCCETIEPNSVIIYGKVTSDIRGITPEIYRVPSFMEQRRDTVFQKAPKIDTAATPKIEEKHEH